jgi:glutathione peroxidase
VNGPGRHPVYAELVQAADDEGRDGDISWNFEKFLIDGSGGVVARFAPSVVPDDPRVVSAIEWLLA